MRPPVRTIHRKLVAAAWILAIGLLTTSAQAAIITVNTTDDENNNDGDCSLLEAIASANGDVAVDACTAGSGTDTINLPAGTYTTFDGLGNITTSLSLVGAGVGSTILTGTADFSYVRAAGGSLTLSDLSVSGASMTNSVIEVAAGTFTLQRVLIASSTGTSSAIYGQPGVNIAIIDSEVRTWNGDILYFDGNTLTVSRSLFRQNLGGIYLDSGIATFENTTISGNSIPSALIYVNNTATVSMSSCTVYGNVSDPVLYNNAGTFSIKSTIVAGNSSGPAGDFFGPFTSGGNNIVPDFNAGFASGFGVGEIGYLGYSLPALADNGGPTYTHLPAAGNAAINNGSCTNVAGAAVTVDQRSVARPASNCDVGAVEAAAVASIPTLSEWGMIVLFGGIAITLAVSATRRLNETPTPQC